MPTDLRQLLEQWGHETRYLSLGICDHPICEQIVGMGEQAVPELLAHLDKHPLQCMGALRRITGTSPVPKADRGYVSRMIEAWKQWGRQRQ